MMGKGYVRTHWSYGEKPVSSDKLNTWDANIEEAFTLVHEMLSLAWGGGDGVVRQATAHDLKVVAQSPPGMTVKVRAGRAFISRLVYSLRSDTDTGAIEPPTTNPRMDIVEAVLEDWSVRVKQGEEDASPSPPAVSSDCLKLAEIYCRPGMTCIKDEDDGVNGYLIDRRAFV